MVGTHKEDGWDTPIEVELAQKSIERLRAILWMHAHWRAEGRIAGVIYVCGDQDGRDRVRRVAEKSRSFPPGSIGLRIELLDTVKREAIEMCEQSRAARSSRSAGELQPAGDRAD